VLPEVIEWAQAGLLNISFSRTQGFLLLLCCRMMSLKYICQYFVELKPENAPSVYQTFFQHRHRATSLEIITIAITVIPVAWKMGVFQQEDRSSPLSSAVDWYRLLCPLRARHMEEISVLLPYKTERFGCTVFSSGNVRTTTSIASTASPSSIHLATQNKRSSFMKLYLKHLDHSTTSSLLY